MRSFSPESQQELRKQFGPRVTFDPLERSFYAHDVGSLPSLVKPLAGNTLPAGVVQPLNEEQLVQLVAFSRTHGVPLVPRSKSTSGYGGVLPVKGGLVVDFSWMNQVLAIDAAAGTACVQPGVVWEKAEKELRKQNLALRTYPSSAPSSTVGGWLAQGGVGFGAYEYGAFRESVVSCRVVLPSGQVREFAGADLDLVSDAEGITGLISQVTLRVRPAEEGTVWGARFDSADRLSRALETIRRAGLPIWSISFINPKMAELKNQLPPHMEHGHPVEEHRPGVPAGYLAIFVAPESRRDTVAAGLAALVREAGGEMVADEVANHEWEERFNLMAVKRLGPSIAPAEVMVPLANLGMSLRAIEEQIALPMVMEGMVSQDGQVTLLGFILHDERTLGFNFAFGLALTVLKIAKKAGGRAYSTGLYFSGEAASVLGKERLGRLREFKAKVDPANLFNPGKVASGQPLLTAFMGMAGLLEPVVRRLGNAAKAPIGERPAGEGRRGIPDDVAWYAWACSQCGYCVDECDQYYGRGWESQTPRGKWYYLRHYMQGKADWDQKMVDTILACTTCELCNVRCSEDLPIEPSWLKLRGQLVHHEGRMTFPPFEIMRQSMRKEHNIWAAYRADRPKWMPEEALGKLPERAEIAYFPGCTASYVENDIAQATACLLYRSGVEFTYLGQDEACCGIPMLVSGLWDTWEEIMRHNIAAMRARGVKTVVTSCPACWLVWHTFYPEWAQKLGIPYEFETKHYSEILAERIEAGALQFDHEVNMKVTWHDSCHMGRAGNIYEAPRHLLRAIPGLELVEMEHHHQEAHCCGSVLTLVADPDVGERIGDTRLAEAEAVGAQAVVAACPCCEVQLRVTADKTKRDLPIIDLTSLACRAAGVEHPDPTPYALEMWSVFEKMIRLLKPEAMAGFMAGLLPEMIEAMPTPFRGMMKMVKTSPAPVRSAMIGAMKPVMPFLFPRLMPGMMPKVMPAMLTAVGKAIPMPKTMEEQMPDLMPAAMGNLLPKMLPLIIPHFMPYMEAYLKGDRA
ncbi:MAG TPA: FAD-binding and (Fe-S)-binding domain-containing protein [Anaerolineae bacterium]|nr:FAD-binding and (Fe-S)-binding domain-containing protein [Anaerolineae bacterium]